MPRFQPHLLLVAVVTACLAGCAPVLVAPPQLVAIWPAAGASLPVAQTTFDLTFNRALHAQSTWAIVSREEDGSPIAVDSTVLASNPRRLSVVLKEPAAGQYRLHWHAVAARTSAVLDGEQAFSMQDESVAPPRIEVAPLVAETGDKVHVAGTGFGKRCSVNLTIGDDEQALSTVETDASGGFAVEERVPQTVPFGEQPVSATDMCGATTTSALQVRWGGWPPLVASYVGQSGPEPGEVTFWLSLRNRSDYVLEHVHVVLTDPPGAGFVGADPAATRQEQSLSWDISTMDRGVLGPYRVTYRVADATTSHAWIEFRHRRPHGCSGEDCLPAFVSEAVAESKSVLPAGSAAAATPPEPTATSVQHGARRSK